MECRMHRVDSCTFGGRGIQLQCDILMEKRCIHHKLDPKRNNRDSFIGRTGPNHLGQLREHVEKAASPMTWHRKKPENDEKPMYNMGPDETTPSNQYTEDYNIY
mmetsp:Transcript_15845/g.29954  ORF Transcript_15845/g.29954 Transcript_15845/m.29954 type:complete len:104 (+) Transcript_15845:1349-1660(+)